MSEFRRRLLYSKKKEALNYLCFTALEEGTFTFTYPSALSTSLGTSMSYSIDEGVTWTTLDNVSSQVVSITTPTVAIGGKVLWRGNNTRLAYSANEANSSKFSSTGQFDISGNIGSLLFENKFNGKKVTSQYAFSFIFSACKVVNAKDLTLIPFTGSHCYFSIFRSCTSLLTAPTLPFTSLSNFCYNAMFYNCYKLEIAPELPATVLASYCYTEMFRYCPNLRYIKAMFLDNPSSVASTTLKNWVQGVASTGTFVMNSDATWDAEENRGADGVPSGWTVETADS